jgi:tetratricopeptide (TPR) repeat protein
MDSLRSVISDIRRELAAGNLARALEITDGMSARAGSSPEFVALQASVLARSGQSALAIEQLSRFIRDNPAVVPPRIQLAQLLVALGRNDDAEREAREALQRDSASFGALAVLAEVHADSEATDEHTAILARLARHADCSGRLFYDAVKLLAERQKWDEVAEITEFLPLRPDFEELCTIRCHALSKLRRTDEAVACLGGLISTFGQDVRDLVSEVLSAGTPLIAARLLAAVGEQDAVLRDAVREAKQAVNLFCRDTVASITAGGETMQFSECVQALYELTPENAGLQDANARACAILLRRARRAQKDNDTPAAISMLRRASAAPCFDNDMRILCADLFEQCGDVRGAILALLPIVATDEAVLHRVLGLLGVNRDWMRLDGSLVEIRRQCKVRSGFIEKLEAVSEAIELDLWEKLDSPDVSSLLEHALALAALSKTSECFEDVIGAVLKRSRRAIRKVGFGDRTLVSKLCLMHLTLAPFDREVKRKFVKLELKSGRHNEGRALLAAELERDPHDEGFWSDLASCDDALFLADEARYARARAELFVPSTI